MKKFIKSQIKSILTTSSNRQGISLEKIQKSFPYDNLNDKLESILNEDKDVIKIKLNAKENTKNNYIYKLTDDYIKSKNFEIMERKKYNLDYLCSLFKEAEIINIYKLIKDHDKITYQQIGNYLNKIYDLKKDIKQVSHYCLILVKINQILSYQPVTVEKFNKSNIVANGYLKFLKENENFKKNNNNEKTKKMSSISKLNKNANLFKLLTRSFVIDDNEIKNTIMFHLYLNKEKEGVSANELYVSCDFIRREKILNKVISYMENESSISHKALRKGKIMEFLYHIIDEGKVPPRIKYLVSYFKKIISKHNNEAQSNKKLIKDNKKSISQIKNSQNEDGKNKNNIEIKSKINTNNNDNIINFKSDKEEDEDNASNSNIKNNIILESEILNKEDYSFILDKMKEKDKKIIKGDDINVMSKNIINYISSIEKNKNVSLSSYNRYIFILNLLYQKKVLSLVEIKHHISKELEQNKDFVIDRKTIRRLLTTLEKIGLVKITRYELTMRNLSHKYLNAKEEIRQEKIIAVHRDVDINDNLFYNKAIEKLKPNKKIETKNDDDDKDIKKMIGNKSLNKLINDVMDKNNNKIIINLKAKLFIPIYNILRKIEAKRKINSKKEFSLLIQKLRQNLKSFNYINNLYHQNNKENEIINNYKNDNFIENYYKNTNYNYSSLIKDDSFNYGNIIIPTYIINKYHNSNKAVFVENSDEQIDKLILNELEKPILSIKSKYYIDENNFETENNENININETKKENNLLINHKRYRDIKLKDIPFGFKNPNKNVLINEILEIICNLPGVTIKTLRKMLNVNSNNFYVEKNIITYMINMGLLYAQDFDDKNLEANDDTKLFPHSDINLFI